MAHVSNRVRTSTSSQQSATSSTTLNSRHSGHEIENGEASSSIVGPRNDRHASTQETQMSGARGGGSRNSSGRGDDEAQDHSRRSHKPRRSGGFLLESSFIARAEDTARRLQHRDGRDQKGKGRADDELHRPRNRPSSRLGGEGSIPSERSPLSRQVSGTDDGSRAGLGIAVEDHQHTDGTGDDRSASRGSQVTAESRTAQRETHPSSGSNTAAINPTEIVHMALNLSESRRRNFSGGHLTVPVASGRRVTSAGLPNNNNALQDSYHHGAGANLRQHLQQQRRISRNITPHPIRSGTPDSRRSTPSPASPAHEPAVILQHGQDFVLQPSTATLARVEKARRYIELSLEYKRLLQFLPPLKPDTLANGNVLIASSSVPGSSNVHLSRTSSSQHEKQDLGRVYNPMQFIRNRKLRNRERKPLCPGAETFEDSPRVREWVDAVEVKADDEDYRQQYSVSLPPYADQVLEEYDKESESSVGHRKTGTATKAKRPKNEWFTSPAEYLADAVWTEQADHKALLEDRYGNKLFPQKAGSVRTQPRSSKDLIRDDVRRPSVVDPIIITPADHLDESDGSARGRKQSTALDGRRESVSASRFRRNLLRRGRDRSSSSSGLSSSENEGPSRQTRSWIEENTGPLERHMQLRLASEADADVLASPSVGSPDKWGPEQNARLRKAIRESITDDADHGEPSSQRASLEVPSYNRQQRQPARLVQRSRDPSSSVEDLDSTAPNSPVVQGHVPRISLDLTPPGSRRQSQTRASRKSKFSLFRDHVRDRRGSQADDDAERLSRQSTQADDMQPQSPGRGVIKRFTHKSSESITSLDDRPTSRGNKEGKGVKESNATSSTVARFFKGHRLGEIVRTEGAKVGDLLWKKDSRNDDHDTSTDVTPSTSDSEPEKNGASRTRATPTHRQTTDASGQTVAVKTERDRSRKPQYTLPSFVSSSQTNGLPQPGFGPNSPEEGSPSRLDLYRDRRRSRFNPFGSLKPERSSLSLPPSPNRALSRESTITPFDEGRRGSNFLSASPISSPSRSPTRVRKASARLTAVLDVPGSSGRGGLPHTGLTDQPADRLSPRPSIASKRHWSISDRSAAPERGRSDHRHRHRGDGTSSSAITKADLERTRALLLSSGIKARELHRRAFAIRDPPPAFLVSAASTATAAAEEYDVGDALPPNDTGDGATTDPAPPPLALRPVPRREEPLLAARLLHHALTARTASLRAALSSFPQTTRDPLEARLADLHSTLTTQLAPRVRATADDADAFAAELAGGGPDGGLRLQAKRVGDRVERMVRARRRRMRWVRKAGWVLLEWVLIGFMWWAWMVVVVIRGLRGVVLGVGRGVRWLLWL